MKKTSVVTVCCVNTGKVINTRRKVLEAVSKPGGAGSEVWNRVYMIAPVKKFGRVGLCTNFIPNKHGGGEEGELAELAVIWCTRVCVGSALFPLFQV